MNGNMRIFNSAWTKAGESGDTATMLDVESQFSRGGRVVLINAGLTPDWGHAYFMAKKPWKSPLAACVIPGSSPSRRFQSFPRNLPTYWQSRPVG